MTQYGNMHHTQLIPLANLVDGGELPEITVTSAVANWGTVRANYFNGNLEWIGFDMGTVGNGGVQEPTPPINWPAGAVYFAISANSVDKGAVTISGVPEDGGCEISDEQIQEIAGIAAGMVEVPEGGDWIMLGPVELTEESAHIELYAEDEEGNPIAFDEAVFCAQLKANEALDTGLYNSIYLMTKPGVTANKIEFRTNSFTPNNASHTGYLFGTIAHRGAWVADLHGYKYSTYREGQTDTGIFDRLLSGADVNEMTSISLSNIYGRAYGIGTKFAVVIKPKR